MIYTYISQVLTVEKAMRVLSDDTKHWDRLYGEYGFRPQYPELTDPRSIAKMLISNSKMCYTPRRNEQQTSVSPITGLAFFVALLYLRNGVTNYMELNLHPG